MIGKTTVDINIWSVEGNQSRILSIRKALYIFKCFAINASWSIQWNNIREPVIKPIAIGLISGNLLKRCTHKQTRENSEENIKRSTKGGIISRTTLELRLVYILVIVLIIYIKLLKNLKIEKGKNLLVLLYLYAKRRQ